MADLRSLGNAGNTVSSLLEDTKDGVKKLAKLLRPVVAIINDTVGADLPENVVELELVQIGYCMANVDGNISQKEVDFICDIAGLPADLDLFKSSLEFTAGFLDKPSPFYGLLRKVDAATNSSFSNAYISLIELFVKAVALSDGNFEQKEVDAANRYIELCKSAK